MKDQPYIAVLDYGSRYVALLAQRLREAGVYSDIVPWDTPIVKIKDRPIKGVVMSGRSLSQRESLDWESECISPWLELGVPVLGLGYSMLALARHFGGVLEASETREFSPAKLQVRGDAPLLRDLQDHEDRDGYPEIDVWIRHGDRITALPSEFEVIATGPHAPVAGFFYRDKSIYGLQFHPEVPYTRQGQTILQRFVSDVCECDATWTMENIIVQSIESIREQVGEDRVLLNLAGGLESMVLAMLLHRALGDQLVCMLIDTGLLRAGDFTSAIETFLRQLDLNVVQVNAVREFASALQGVTDGAEKRRRISDIYVSICGEQINKLHEVKWYAQGNLYFDENRTEKLVSDEEEQSTATLVGEAIVPRLNLSVLEPIKNLFRREVMTLGRELDIPGDLLVQHPFPRAGLAVRIAGEATEDNLQRLREADAIYMEELRRHNLYQNLSQAFAVLIPEVASATKLSGQNVIVLRAILTADYVTAEVSRLPEDVVQQITTRILREVIGVDRVVFDLTPKPPADIEWQ